MFSKGFANDEGSKSVANVERSRGLLRANLGPLGQKYVETVLRGAQNKESNIDVYSVYLHKNGLMFDNKRFNVDDADNIINVYDTPVYPVFTS